jgi:hypothetical protein
MALTGVLIQNDIAISVHGKGSWHDNLFVERLIAEHTAPVGEARTSIARRYCLDQQIRMPSTSTRKHAAAVVAA